MSYLQPWMLWALPAVLLPIIIHLLNRLRYKTVHWAAMIFLLKANRAATRKAKIRQYLLLACRCLVLLFFIWALSRPLTGGWIGAAAGGAPEVVLILLDRSASMEARVGDPGTSKRAHALSLLSQASKQSEGSRFVLIENVLKEPLEIAAGSTLASLQTAEPTDTAADLPAMLRAALDYLGRNKPGSAEMWIASDLQASNWKPESPEWQDISARFAGMTQPVSVRVLDLSGSGTGNLSIAMKGAELRLKDPKAGTGQLSLVLEIRSDGERQGPVPARVTKDGATSQVDVTVTGAVQRQNLRFDLPKSEPGWGKVELPADSLENDNAAYFVYAPPLPLKTMVVGEGPAAVRQRFASAPDPNRQDRTAEQRPPATADSVDLKDIALLIWNGATVAEGVEKKIAAWVESGGVLLCFPTGGESATAPLGVSWAAVETAPKETPFRVPTWDDLDGPLSRTDNGTQLPVARLEINQRQVPNGGEGAHVYATFGDGRAFLTGRKVGAGHVFACSASPDPQWGTFSEGLVLVPMIQRLVTLGGQRLAPPSLAVAGEWRPVDADQPWSAVETDRRRDWRWHAGVYQSGASRVALNRPEAEDGVELVNRDRLPELLKGSRLTVMNGAMELKADRLQSEIWPALIVVAMAFMCVEMLLATSKAMLPVRPSPKSPSPASRPPAARREEKPVEAGV
jgi:hypothetical protein